MYTQKGVLKLFAQNSFHLPFDLIINHFVRMMLELWFAPYKLIGSAANPTTE